MQLAEIHLLQGTEHERAADMYERAIYAMECAFHSAFKPWRVESAAAGGGGGGGNQPRLPFAGEANKPLHRALFRFGNAARHPHTHQCRTFSAAFDAG